MRAILDAFAQYEKALIVLRTKADLARKREKGERVGMVPYGKRLAADGVHLLDDPAEQAVVATVRELCRGGLSYRAIAAELNRCGMTNRAGGQFSQTQVVRMLEAVERKQSGVSEVTINRGLAFLKNLFTKAMEWDHVTENPVKPVKFYREDNGRVRVLTEEEEARLLTCCPPQLTPLVVTALHTGFRASELLSLTWADVYQRGA
jgi:hypothetical protein